MDADRIIADIASAQHSVVTRSQLLAAGVSGRQIDHRLVGRLLVPIHRGVYRPAGSQPSWHQRIMAATLAAAPAAVASHRAAAFLHGLTAIEPRAEVTVARVRAPQPEGVLVHRLSWLATSDVEVREGIARTRPPATLLGLAAVVPVPLLEAALDDALVRGLVSSAQLQRRLDAIGHAGRPGAAALTELLAVRHGHPKWTQSEFVRKLYALLHGADLALPVPQFEVRLPDGRRAFLDFAWPDVRLAMEADSYRHHAGRIAWGRDHTRNSILISMGWRILPVTWEDMVERPRELIATLRRARAA